ncbi:3-oxoacyl-ACP reductase FabG [Rhodococcus opacus]|uniref:SDR family NAD(P)-dependent oxidoreductase n=1 Tax=Rhodococcus opacus TaxID=37919 RepID=UPI0002A25A01|nr:3-oxoacyl-ACP reductase FabG [Rhodococcus opacus]ELB92068.1 3-oxoacyl-(acyl-carrier-protein) reductase [Rhodococcus wratislaviensis IFP 2016]MDX5963469.1 3-oxoacyl-ACP reductase FabG [Rhodococcus opacus]NKY76811.1 3-oxoacyl-ACP reductase FabG [Rhodococcus opacus]CAG7605002.1 3-oxoacyl-[acyl-carrier-protein] reductase FabG [Rhodococcus opacus]
MKDKRVALVTGAGAGIGAAIAERLGQAGRHVVLTDLNQESASALAADMKDRGMSADALAMDVGDRASIETAFKWVSETYGRCDILVNNAGFAKIHSFVDCPDDYWQASLNVNLTGAFRCGQHAARLMLEQRWGRIINIASISGMRAGAGRTAYGTTKAGLIGLTRQMAIELAPHGITANAVAPGPIETPQAQAVHTAATRAAYNQLVPAQRYGQPDEIAAAVSFLASDDAAYVNGHVVPVDGGFMAAGMLSV